MGREKLVRRLTAVLADAGHGRGSAVLLYGAPGIGKTRLSSEIREFASINGFQSCSVRATHSEAARPLALAISIASAIQDLPGVAGTSPAALALISRLCRPSTWSVGGDVASLEPISPTETGWALADAVAAATHEGRLFLSIDDIHNADALSLQVLSTLARAASSHRLVLLATSRLTSITWPQSSAASLTAFIALPVPPLSESDATVLVSAFASSPQKPISHQASAAIIRAGGGNPLFLRELTSQRVSPHGLKSVPQSLIEVIEQRISHLSTNELRLLRLISLLGPLARLSRIRALLPTKEWHYDSFLEQLELEGVLSMGAAGSLELHECWHDAVGDALKGTALSAMSLDVASLLSAETSTDASFSNYWRAAELFALAGSLDESREQFRLVADLFTGRGLPQQAVKALSQALALSGEVRGRVELLTQLAGAQNTAALYADAVASCESALAGATEPSPESATARTRALTILVDSQLKMGRPFHDAIEALALTISNADVPDYICQHSCHVALRSLFNSGSKHSAHVFHEASLKSSARSGRSLLGSVIRLMYAAECGTASNLIALEREVAEGHDDSETLSIRMLGLRNRATALRFLGRPEDAAEVMNQAVELAKAFGALRDARLAAASLIFLHLDHANHVQARRWLDEAERLAAPTQGIDIDHSLVHARARYLVEVGDATACLDEYAPHMEAIRVDTVPRRNAADWACLTLAFAGVGDVESALAACEIARNLLEKLSPGINEDWVADGLLRSLKLLGKTEQARTLAADYLRRRESTFDRPIPTGFAELTAANDTRTHGPERSESR